MRASSDCGWDISTIIVCSLHGPQLGAAISMNVLRYAWAPSVDADLYALSPAKDFWVELEFSIPAD